MRKPNIIILNPDEMRWDAMGHMGNPAAVTPALDNFAGTDGPAKSNAYWPKKTAQLDPEAHEKSTMIFDGHYKYVHRPSGRNDGR